MAVVAPAPTAVSHPSGLTCARVATLCLPAIDIGFRCSLWPPCPEYTSPLIGRYGVVHGLKLTTCRLLKCLPFHPEGMGSVK